jgi:hypothetical protein
VLPPGTSAGEKYRSSALQILYRARQREMVQPWRFSARYCRCAGVAWLIYSNSQAVPPAPGGEPAIPPRLVERNRGRATHLQYLIGGTNLCGRVNLGRSTAEAALKKASEFLQEGYLDVRISTPRGRLLLPEEFDQLD